MNFFEWKGRKFRLSIASNENEEIDSGNECELLRLKRGYCAPNFSWPQTDITTQSPFQFQQIASQDSISPQKKEEFFFSKFVFMPAARIPKSSKSKSFHTLKSRKIHQCLFIGDGMQMGVSFLIQNTKYWDHFKLIQIYYFECVKCPVLLIIHSFIIINLSQL